MLALQRSEQIAPMQRNPIGKSVLDDVASCDGKRIRRDVDCIDPGMGKRVGRENFQRSLLSGFPVILRAYWMLRWTARAVPSRGSRCSQRQSSR